MQDLIVRLCIRGIRVRPSNDDDMSAKVGAEFKKTKLFQLKAEKKMDTINQYKNTYIWSAANFHY